MKPVQILVIGTMVIELREFKEKKKKKNNSMDKIGKNS